MEKEQFRHAVECAIEQSDVAIITFTDGGKVTIRRVVVFEISDESHQTVHGTINEAIEDVIEGEVVKVEEGI